MTTPALEDELALDDEAPAADLAVEQAASGYVTDYVSGKRVRATPEEVDAVQVFAQRLVEDYNYPKTHLQTRPQFRVRKRPSDERKKVFQNELRRRQQRIEQASVRKAVWMSGSRS